MATVTVAPLGAHPSPIRTPPPPPPRLPAWPARRLHIPARRSRGTPSLCLGASSSKRPKRPLGRGHPPAAFSGPSSPALPVDEVITLVREALGLDSAPPGCLIKLTGTQALMGMDGQWEFIFCSKGIFAEAFVGSKYASVAAFDGASVWEADVAGRVALLDLDDYEVALLTVWLRTGFWVHPAARDSVDIRGLEAKDWELLRARGELDNLPLDSSENTFLAVSLHGKKTIMYVAISRSDWLPSGAILNAYGTWAVATMQQWTSASPDLPLQVAVVSSLLRDTGDLVLTTVAGVEVVFAEENSLNGDDSCCHTRALLGSSIYPRESLFKSPQSMWLAVPLDIYPVASLDSAVPPEVEAYQTAAGHILVRPLIDGKDVGYFILDTGASTFTIEPSVADTLGMSKFGCVSTVTVSGPAKCSFRECRSFSLGPLRIENPRFVDVAGAALAEKSLPVVGICGYDVFHHATVHLRRAPVGVNPTLKLLNPGLPLRDEDILDPGKSVIWLGFRMLSATPQIPLEFQVDPSSQRHEGLFLLDTGAAGSDLIFNSASTLEYDLWPKSKSRSGGGFMRGMISQEQHEEKSLGPGMAVTQRGISEVAVGDIIIRNVCAIVMAPEQNGLQLSCYTAGLACQNLLQDFDLLLDYKNQRLGLIARHDVLRSGERIARPSASGG